MSENSNPQEGGAYLFKVQVGPVQDFIAQARSTRDLWSGSYLLSWLMAVGIQALPQKGRELIFPNPEKQPLLKLLQNSDLPSGNHSTLLTPNLPNIFIARISGDGERTARQIAKAIEEEWKEIANAVWGKLSLFHLPDRTKDRFDAQSQRHLSIEWQATPLDDDSDVSYREAYRENGWHLDAVRQTRRFIGWDSATGTGEKDSLSGREEALVGGTSFQEKCEQKEGAYRSLFAKHADYLGAVVIIKRTWHLAYLRERWQLKTESKDFRIRSIPAIAGRKSTHDDEHEDDEDLEADEDIAGRKSTHDDEPINETGEGGKYIAAIAFDGDSIGKWVNGDHLPDDQSLAKHHSNFSDVLSDFALNLVRDIIEEPITGSDGKPTVLGQLIYAGGDDVVALVPADAALDVAARLRGAFRECTKDTPSNSGTPDASAGIAIAHIHSPLQDLIRAAREAEKRAKTTVGRPAFSITLMKRSGEISHWGSRWEPSDPNLQSGGLDLYRAIDGALETREISTPFPHRVCQLLDPYRTVRTGISSQSQSDPIDETSIAINLIAREFRHAAIRQGSKEIANTLEPILVAYLKSILTDREERLQSKSGNPPTTAIQELLEATTGLCTTVAFAARNRENSSKPQKLEPTPA